MGAWRREGPCSRRTIWFSTPFEKAKQRSKPQVFHSEMKAGGCLLVRSEGLFTLIHSFLTLRSVFSSAIGVSTYRIESFNDPILTNISHYASHPTRSSVPQGGIWSTSSNGEPDRLAQRRCHRARGPALRHKTSEVNSQPWFQNDDLQCRLKSQP